MGVNLFQAETQNKGVFEWYGRIYQKLNENFGEISEESTRLRGRIL